MYNYILCDFFHWVSSFFLFISMRSLLCRMTNWEGLEPAWGALLKFLHGADPCTRHQTLIKECSFVAINLRIFLGEIILAGQACFLTTCDWWFTPGYKETLQSPCCWGWLPRWNVPGWSAKYQNFQQDLGLPGAKVFCVHISGSWFKREIVSPKDLAREDKGACLHLASQTSY